MAVTSTRCRKTHPGSTGSAARRSTSANATSSSDRDREEQDAGDRRPRPAHAALEQGEQEQHAAGAEQHRARVVDPVLPALDALLEAPPQHPQGGEADRDVDEEDPAPGQVVGEDAAQGGADHRRDRPHAGEVALDLGPLLERVEVADDRHRHRLDGAGAEALDRPEHDQRGHPPCDAAGQRADEEDPDADQHHRLAAVEVGELGEDRDRDRLREEVDGEQPRELGEAAEVADDRRHGGGEDRRVDRDQADAQHHREEHRPALAPQAHRGPGDFVGRHDNGNPRPRASVPALLRTRFGVPGWGYSCFDRSKRRRSTWRTRWRSGRDARTRWGRRSTGAARTSRCSARSRTGSSCACSRPTARVDTGRPGSS